MYYRGLLTWLEWTYGLKSQCFITDWDCLLKLVYGFGSCVFYTKLEMQCKEPSKEESLKMTFCQGQRDDNIPTILFPCIFILLKTHLCSQQNWFWLSHSRCPSFVFRSSHNRNSDYCATDYCAALMQYRSVFPYHRHWASLNKRWTWDL